MGGRLGSGPVGTGWRSQAPQLKEGLGPQVEGSLLALAGCVPADKHAVEMTVARLRRAFGPAAAVIQTVVKRGHRLDVQHGAEWSAEPAPATVAGCLP